MVETFLLRRYRCVLRLKYIDMKHVVQTLLQTVRLTGTHSCPLFDAVDTGYQLKKERPISCTNSGNLPMSCQDHQAHRNPIQQFSNAFSQLDNSVKWSIVARFVWPQFDRYVYHEHPHLDFMKHFPLVQQLFDVTAHWVSKRKTELSYTIYSTYWFVIRKYNTLEHSSHQGQFQPAKQLRRII